MELLTWLTLIYLAILVLTLAIGLIVILKTLASVSTKLGQISGGLQQVDTNTAPLNAGVEQLNGSLSNLVGGLKVAEASFGSAAGHLRQTLHTVAGKQ